MKKQLPEVVERGRIRSGPWGSTRRIHGNNGAFVVPINGVDLMIISGCGEGWDHVSVSTDHRCPTWEEMDAIKRLFFEPEETAIQFHPPEHLHINKHPFCLHIWRSHHQSIELPPGWMIA